jgi:endoglucanase
VVPASSSSSFANVESSSSQGTIAIHAPVDYKTMRLTQPRLRFDDQKVFIEKNGKRFDLKGHRIK